MGTFAILYLAVALFEYVREITLAYVNDGFHARGSWWGWDVKIASWFIPALFWPITYLAIALCYIHRRW